MKLAAFVAVILAATGVRAIAIYSNEALSKLHLRSGLEANAATLHLEQRGADVEAIEQLDSMFTAGDASDSVDDHFVKRGLTWPKLNPLNLFKSPKYKLELWEKVEPDADGWPIKVTRNGEFVEKLEEKHAKPYLKKWKKEKDRAQKAYARSARRPEIWREYRAKQRAAKWSRSKTIIFLS